MRTFLSKLKTALYRRPKDELIRLLRWGPNAYFCCSAWIREMEMAVGRLPVLEPTTSERGMQVEVWFLTGAKFWFQTAFCAWTLAKHSGRELIVNIVDDGTLNEDHISGIRRLFPNGVLVEKGSVYEALERLLPNDRYPMLRLRWNDYVNIRKITDVHLGSTGAKLVLDSDMLFYKKPTELLKWWDNAKSHQDEKVSMCLMTDCVESYGYSRQLMESICGSAIPSKLNVGICGMKSEDIDWDQLEDWCERLHDSEGTSYYLEQALVAMMAAQSPHGCVMPSSDYITFPTRGQVESQSGVLQHYVADSKPWYFSYAWKRASNLQ